MASRGRKRPSDVEGKLARIGNLRAAQGSQEATALLRDALSDSSNHVVALAASVAQQLELVELAAPLVAAFDRFLADPGSDKTCAAKIAIARALDALDLTAEGYEVFARGLRHVQLEAAWGPPVDTAASLRAICAGGLARTRDAEVVLSLVDLLVDSEKLARMGAAQALGCTGRHEAIPVLRLKVLTGDRESEVTNECFASLLSLDPDAGVDFVARFLSASEEGLREAAALALGQSRQAKALDVLHACWSGPHERTFGRVLLLSIALLRLPRSTDLLIELIVRGERPSSVDAIAALAVFRDDIALRSRVEGAVEEAIKRGAEKGLRKTMEAEFSPARE